jgi:hypothetical protein
LILTAWKLEVCYRRGVVSIVIIIVVWNSIATTDANKLERIQQKFAALCYNRFLPHAH